MPTQAAFSLTAHEEGNNFHLLGGRDRAGVQRAGNEPHGLAFREMGTRDVHVSHLYWLGWYFIVTRKLFSLEASLSPILVYQERNQMSR